MLTTGRTHQNAFALLLTNIFKLNRIKVISFIIDKLRLFYTITATKKWRELLNKKSILCCFYQKINCLLQISD